MPNASWAYSILGVLPSCPVPENRSMPLPLWPPFPSGVTSVIIPHVSASTLLT